jgi:predicted negative regulator of RcsB-dependent stress response
LKQNAGPAAIVAAVIVVLLLLGFLGWKTFAPHNDSADPVASQSRQAAKKADHKD